MAKNLCILLCMKNASRRLEILRDIYDPNFGFELKQLNRKMAEIYLLARYAAFPRLVGFDK